MSVLKTLPDESVHCCVTSPPYWGLRSYGTQPQIWGGQEDCEHEFSDCGSRIVAVSDKRQSVHTSERDSLMDGKSASLGNICRHCRAWRGELGSEPTIDLFIEHLVTVFREVRRVLRSDGTCWVNLGDSYAQSQVGRHRNGKGDIASDYNRSTDCDGRSQLSHGLKPKDLCGVPFRFVLAAQADGWYWRDTIVWHKPAPMPESVRDRCTKSWEPIFMLAKSERYFFDAEAVKENVGEISIRRATTNERLLERTAAGSALCISTSELNGFGRDIVTDGRNLRNVWRLGPEPNSDSAYDFQNADYVDARGIPRILSQDCPVHGRSAQPPQVDREAVSCGEPEGDQVVHTEHICAGHAPSQEAVASPTSDCNTQPVKDNQPEYNRVGKRASKRRAVRAASPEMTSGSSDTLRSLSSNRGSQDQQDSGTAISHNTSLNKSAPSAHSSQDGIASVETSSCKSSTQSETSEKPLCRSTPESSILGDSSSSERPTEQLETGGDTVRISVRGSCNDAKCTCRISQVQHFACFPSSLPERCIKAGTSEKGCCAECGKPWVRVTERTKLRRERPNDLTKRNGAEGTGNHCANSVAGVATETLGWEPSCTCNAGDPIPCTVLEPFCGSGTTLKVAEQLGRRSIGIELNPTYAHEIAVPKIKLALTDRTVKQPKSLAGQGALFE